MAKKKRDSDDESSDEDVSEDESMSEDGGSDFEKPKNKVTAAPKQKPAAKKVVSENESEGEGSDFEKPKKKATAAAPKAAKAAAAPKPKPAAKKAKLIADDDDDEDLFPGAGGGGADERSNSAKKKLEEKFKKLTQREHVLVRPDTYVGTIEKTTQNMWVLTAGKKLVNKEITFIPALYKIFDEILVNASDNKKRDPSMREIRVNIDSESGEISVRNDGKGIPVEIHGEHNIYIPELIFGHLLTGENFDDDEKRTVGGRNGYGAKLANIFSSRFTIETSDSKSKQNYVQVWENNMQHCRPAKITKATAKDFTQVSFIPDFKYFKLDGWDEDHLSLLRKRVYDIAGVADRGLKVYLNGELVPCNNFRDYVAMYVASAGLPGGPAKESEPAAAADLDTSMTSKDGAADGVKAPSKAEAIAAALKNVVFTRLNDYWEIAVAMAPEEEFLQVSFVNSICTYRGGTHVSFVQEKIAKYLLEHIAKKYKKLASVVKVAQIKSQMWLFVNATVVNPSFETQTKDFLSTKASAFGGKDGGKEFIPDLDEILLAKIAKNTGIVERVLSWADRKQFQQINKIAGKKKSTLLDIPKLDDANNAGGKNSDKCTLILTEGDSAKTLALSGISVVGRDNYGVFPLKGKLLNVREAGHAAIMKNAEIQNLMKIIGLKPGEKYENTKSLRYGHVMVMTDQDQDGSHIKGLLFNFFHYYFPTLLQLPGFLQVFVTPLVKVSNKTKMNAFYSAREYDEWKLEIAHDARVKALAKDPGANEDILRAIEVAALKQWRVKYYKGLGTNSSKEAQEYFARMDSHSIEMEFIAQTSGDALDMAFSKVRAEDRKQWLLRHDPETFIPVDFRAKTLDYRHFVDGELVLFSLADNARSIPSVLDGFKPSQRKVLYACFKRNLIQEIKVSQLSGYVSEHAAYHHGEESLSGTIVGMAQTFVGSNNIALLHAGGAFGTRRLGGKDSASPRYIFTKLLRVARILFNADDDNLLKRVEDDGILVEPETYVPIIPMLLVNGATGIGTGWSTEIPSYDPRLIIESVRARLDGVPEDAPKLVPFYRGYSGEIFEDAKSKKPGRFIVKGKFELQGEVLFITELPVGKWTAAYKEFLLAAVNGAKEAEAAAKLAKEKKKKDTKKIRNSDDGMNEDDDDFEGAPAKKDKKDAASAESTFGRKIFPEGSIVEIRENHTDETVAFEITLSVEFAKKLSDGGDDYIISQFQLQSTISTTNMTAFDVDGKIHRFDRPEEILDVHFARRLAMYSERKDFLVRELGRECETLSAQARFVRMIVDGQLVVAKRKKIEILADLSKKGFPKRLKNKSLEQEVGAQAAPADEDPTADDEESEDEKDAESQGSGKGYDYLLAMPLWSLTLEKVKALEKKAMEKAKELEDLKGKTPEDLWRHDLDELVLAMNEMDEIEGQLRKEQDKVRNQVRRGGKKPVKKRARGGSSDDSDEGDSDFGERKPKRAKVVAPKPSVTAPKASVTAPKPAVTAFKLAATASKPAVAPVAKVDPAVTAKPALKVAVPKLKYHAKKKRPTNEVSDDNDEDSFEEESYVEESNDEAEGKDDDEVEIVTAPKKPQAPAPAKSVAAPKVVAPKPVVAATPATAVMLALAPVAAPLSVFDMMRLKLSSASAVRPVSPPRASSASVEVVAKKPAAAAKKNVIKDESEDEFEFSVSKTTSAKAPAADANKRQRKVVVYKISDSEESEQDDSEFSE